MSSKMTDNLKSHEDEIPARPDLVPNVNNRSSRTVVDWELLLTFNPPPGYKVRNDRSDGEVTGTGTYACTENAPEDKVVVILQNLLRNLESEIKSDKRQLKEEKRSKREERRKQRLSREHESAAMLMTSDYGRRLFHQVTSGPFGPTTKTAQEKRQKYRDWKQKHYSLDEIKVKRVKPLVSRSNSVTIGKYNHLTCSWSRHSTDADSSDTGDTAEESEGTTSSASQGSGYDTVTSSVADFENDSDENVAHSLKLKRQTLVTGDKDDYDSDVDSDTLESASGSDDESNVTREGAYLLNDQPHCETRDNIIGYRTGNEHKVTGTGLHVLDKHSRSFGSSNTDSRSGNEYQTDDNLDFDAIKNRNLTFLKKLKTSTVRTDLVRNRSETRTPISSYLGNCDWNEIPMVGVRNMNKGSAQNKMDCNHNTIKPILSDSNVKQTGKVINGIVPTPVHINATNPLFIGERLSDSTLSRSLEIVSQEEDNSPNAFLKQLRSQKDRSNSFKHDLIRNVNRTGYKSIRPYSTDCTNLTSARAVPRLDPAAILRGNVRSKNSGLKFTKSANGSVSDNYNGESSDAGESSDCKINIFKSTDTLNFPESTSARLVPFGKPLSQDQLWASIESIDSKTKGDNFSRSLCEGMKSEPTHVSTESLYDERVVKGFRPGVRSQKKDVADTSSDSLDIGADFHDTKGHKSTESALEFLRKLRNPAERIAGMSPSFDQESNSPSQKKNLPGSKNAAARRASYRSLGERVNDHVTGSQSKVLRNMTTTSTVLRNGSFDMTNGTETVDDSGVCSGEDVASSRVSRFELIMRSELVSRLHGKGCWKRSQSVGTSGYSTDDSIDKTCEWEEEPCLQYLTDHVTLKRHNDRYFLVFDRQPTMAMKFDNPIMPDQEITQELRPLLNYSTMSDLAIPDHLGWLTDQSEQRRVWCVVVDMLFCVFADQISEKAEAILLLPGCNIRPLVYKTAINGLHTRVQGKTITGIDKYQLVIDNASTGRKHVYSVESQVELDTWFNVLQKASALDPEVTNEVTSSSRRSSVCSETQLSFECPGSQNGYTPSQNSQSRIEKLSGSQPSSPRDGPLTSSESVAPATNGFSNGTHSHPSPVGQRIVRKNSQSVQDFKKLLRREPEAETSKQQPLKARHFEPPTQEDEPKLQQGKKLKSFGSFESLLKFKRKKRKNSEGANSNDDTGSVVSTSSVEQEMTSTTSSVDISAKSSKMKKSKSKQLSKSLDLGQPKNGSGLVRRASDIKDKVFLRRPSKTSVKVGDLKDVSLTGYLHHKTHLKWQKLWCVVCRGSFYGFKSAKTDESACVSVVLANCVVVFVTEKDKRQKHLFVFKLSQENRRSVYLCTDDYKELQKWLTVLQMESNSVIANAHKIRRPYDSEGESVTSSQSSQNSPRVASPTGSLSTDDGISSRSRSKKKKKQAPVKPPRHSSCPPIQSRDQSTDGSSTSSTTDGRTSSTSNGTSSRYEVKSGDFYDPTEDIPVHDKAVTHVWQNDRGYLFNIIRSKLRAYRKQDGGDIYNTDLPGPGNEGLLLLQENEKESRGRKGNREVRRTKSFTTHTEGGVGHDDVSRPMTPQETSTQLRRRHKPLIVKKVSVAELNEHQTTSGYMERRSLSTQWIKYWYVLHEGTLFCYLTPDDTVTVDVLNLRGYTVTCMVDKFRGKRFVLQLGHENFTPLYLSVDTREEMDQWQDCLEKALTRPSSTVKDILDTTEEGSKTSTEPSKTEDVEEKRKQVKQKLLDEMLRQKYELERKQAERHRKQRCSLDSPDRSPNSPVPPEFTSDEQRTSDVTRLRQRRMSTQLKYETIQKQIKPVVTKRGLFSFGKTKKTDENKNEYLQGQLKELNKKMSQIDNEMSQVEQQDKLTDGYDVNQNRKSLSATLPADMFSQSYQDIIDDIEAQKNGGTKFKSTVQKWTNKTFNKTSTKKRPVSDSKLKPIQSVPDLGAKTNGELMMNGHTHEYDSDSTVEETHSQESNSVTDLTRPLSDLKLDLHIAHAHPTANGSPRYSRSNSRSSTLSNLSSPRREIDPSVMAEIEAFEQLTKQVLGARSKELPSK